MKKVVTRHLKAMKNSLSDFMGNVRSKLREQRGDGMGMILSIVAVLIIFAFIIIPQTRTIFVSLFTSLTTYISTLPIFPTA